MLRVQRPLPWAKGLSSNIDEFGLQGVLLIFTFGVMGLSEISPWLEKDEVDLAELTAQLDSRHHRTLDWFRDNAGCEVPWTPALNDGTQIVSTPKGIYKPKWSRYAMSVRQTLNAPYPDREPVSRPDGTWTYVYHQEGEDSGEAEHIFTNSGLLQCLRHGVPVGVMRQTRRKPTASPTSAGKNLQPDFRGGSRAPKGRFGPFFQGFRPFAGGVVGL